MAERTPPPLSPAASELLRAFRDDESPAKAARHQGLSTLRSRLERELSTAANGHSYAKLIAVTVGLAAAVLLAVKFVGVGVTALTGRARQPAMEAPYQNNGAAEGARATSREPAPARAPRGRRARRPSEPEAAPAPVVVAPLPPPEPAAEAPAASRARSTSTRPAAPSSSATDLAAELSLIKRAQRARQQGRPSVGLTALAEHARRFPRGILADERRVLEAELLCDHGEVASARIRVRRFLKTRARSALAGRMRSVCAD